MYTLYIHILKKAENLFKISATYEQIHMCDIIFVSSSSAIHLFSLVYTQI